MTSIESSQILFNHFLNKDYINYNQLLGLVPKGQDNDNGMAAMMAGLEELTNAGLLYRHQEGKENKTITWVLKAPLSMHNQTLSISGPVALSISNIVNEFAHAVETQEIACNPLNIKESDIGVLLDVISMYAQQDQEETVAQTENKKDIKSK